MDYLLSVTLDWKVHMVVSCLSHMDAMFSLKNVDLHKLAYPLVIVRKVLNLPEYPFVGTEFYVRFRRK